MTSNDVTTQTAEQWAADIYKAKPPYSDYELNILVSERDAAIRARAIEELRPLTDWMLSHRAAWCSHGDALSDEPCSPIHNAIRALLASDGSPEARADGGDERDHE